jgi:hypothetical protein
VRGQEGETLNKKANKSDEPPIVFSGGCLECCAPGGAGAWPVRQGKPQMVSGLPQGVSWR